MPTKSASEKMPYRSKADFEHAMFPQRMRELERAKEAPRDLGQRLAEVLARDVERRVQGK
jgi:hypothetical protein